LFCDYAVYRTAKSEVTGATGGAEKETSNAESTAWFQWSFGWVGVFTIFYAFSTNLIY